ncbi:hypothetical protein Pyn_38338 [Prunus yedoensis var. nudiflora]|uniref:Pentatricopeptide repeat-containing protein n=1 Tax=Prunus yedoensis var. nudiflora TaxID=2094558 RepID=A0A314ZTE0_PRUYE|nr:hypothetical protein Pyn_38338 [Prunus yedoensis var. nudiflora]
MASTPPHCSITATKPYQTQRYPQNQPLKSQRQSRQSNQWTKQQVSLPKPLPLPSQAPRTAAKTPTATPTSSFSSLCPLPHPKSDLVTAFSGRRSTRFVSKMHLGRPKTTMGSYHSLLAEEALHQAVQFGNDDLALDDILLSFHSRLCGSDDYTFLFRELGNRGECWKAIRCFEFAVRREKRRTEQGKLASSMISTLGRLGKVELAKNVFQTAVNEGYGKTVYTYSALITAYGRNGYCEEAIRVFESMKDSGLKPNLVTYNAVIDAYGKGGVEFKRVVEIFNEMLRNGEQPDRITYNSLLAVCSRGGLWEMARNLFSEMVDRGIDQDIYTYNTLIDAICKGGQMDLAYQIMSEMPSKNILPNVVIIVLLLMDMLRLVD